MRFENKGNCKINALVFYVFCWDFVVGYIDVQFICVGVNVSFIQEIMLNFSLYCSFFSLILVFRVCCTFALCPIGYLHPSAYI